MAKRALFGKKHSAPQLDELGGGADGGLAILDPEGKPIHLTPSRVSASLRFFVARVQLHDPQGMPARLALTSALFGEGVTYIARSLAAIIAYDTEESVAVVDFNWRKPIVDVDDAAKLVGLADVVEHDVPLDDVVLQTSNPRLSMVPAGVAPIARRPALARSDRLTAVLDDLESRFDHLLLDLPPVLATSEAMNLSQLADSYVLVVRQGVTTQGQVEAALEEMQGVETLGVILNRVDSDIPRRVRRLVGT